MRKWIIAAIIGVLLLFPIILLLQYLAQLQAATGNIMYAYAQSALIFLAYFFLGVFLAVLQGLRFSGTRRFRWPIFLLGVLLLLITVVWKLEQATGFVSTFGLVASSDIPTRFVTFNDGGLYLWVVLAGYFMTVAFEKVPSEGAARGTTQSTVQNVVQNVMQSVMQNMMKGTAQGAAQDTTQSTAQAEAQGMVGVAQEASGETQDAPRSVGQALAAAETTSVRRSDRKKNEKAAKKPGPLGRARSAEPKSKKVNRRSALAENAETKAKKASLREALVDKAEPKAQKAGLQEAANESAEPKPKKVSPREALVDKAEPKAKKLSLREALVGSAPKKADTRSALAGNGEPKPKKADPWGFNWNFEPRAKKADPWAALNWNGEPRTKKADPWDLNWSGEPALEPLDPDTDNGDGEPGTEERDSADALGWSANPMAVAPSVPQPEDAPEDTNFEPDLYGEETLEPSEDSNLDIDPDAEENFAVAPENPED